MIASTTLMISNIFVPLLTVVFGGIGGGYIVWRLNKSDERYRKLYGPLKFNLKMMKLMVENREEVQKDIEDWFDPGMRLNSMQKHMRPLTQKWIEYKDNIKTLFEENPGLIEKQDFDLVSDFMDGCIKREITEEGKNDFAENKNRTTKLLDAIKKLQEKML